MSKYYTPKIEEFYIGFEYEITTLSIGGLAIMDFSKSPMEMKTVSKPDIQVWEKASVNYDNFNPQELYRTLKDINGLLNRKQVRVKYLDKDDLQELGFECKEESCPFEGTKTVGYKTLEEGFNTGWEIEIHLNKQRVVTIKQQYFSSYSTPYIEVEYLIKNKSELIKLLKQKRLL